MVDNIGRAAIRSSPTGFCRWFPLYLLSLIDRINLGFAALTMNNDLGLILRYCRPSAAWLRTPRPAVA